MAATSINTWELQSLDDWKDTYKKLAIAQLEDIECGTPNVDRILQDSLNEACKDLIHQQKAHLRECDQYHMNKIGVALISSVPFTRPLVTRSVGKDFAQLTLNSLGLGDEEQLKKYRESFQGTHNSKSDVVYGMGLKGVQTGIQEIFKDTATDASLEAVHMKPVIGQVIAMGIGYKKMRTKMRKIMDAATESAIDIHREYVIPRALYELRFKIAVKSKSTVHVTVKESRSGSASKDSEPTGDPFGWSPASGTGPMCKATAMMRSSGPVRRLHTMAGPCFRCQLDIEDEAMFWMFLWGESGFVVLCKSCRSKTENEQTIADQLGRGIPVICKTATGDANHNCMAKECEGKGDPAMAELSIACPACSFRLCALCLHSQEEGRCQKCHTDAQGLDKPYTWIISTQLARVSKRPLTVCSVCQKVHGQSADFAICEGCFDEEQRAVFCGQCTLWGRHETHLQVCRSRRPHGILRNVAINYHIQTEREKFTCATCEATFASRIPHASTKTTDDEQTDFCYVCFFTVLKNTSAYCSEGSNSSSFTLFLPDIRERTQDQSSNCAKQSAIFEIPDRVYQGTTPAFKQRVSVWAKETAQIEALKWSMLEAVHWVTQSHVQRSDAAQMGLLGPTAAGGAVVQGAMPGLALPPMAETDFAWTDVPIGSAYPIPCYDLGYIGLPSGGCVSDGYWTCAGTSNGDGVDSGAVCDPGPGVSGSDVYEPPSFSAYDNIQCPGGGTSFMESFF